MNAPTHPLAQLAAAEARLVASIDAAAEAMDRVGTTAVGAALARLAASAAAATARLQHAADLVRALAGGILIASVNVAEEIDAALASGLPTTPTPQAPPAQSPAQAQAPTGPAAEARTAPAGETPSRIAAALALPDDTPATPTETLPPRQVLEALPLLFGGQRPAGPEPDAPRPGGDPAGPLQPPDGADARGTGARRNGRHHARR